MSETGAKFTITFDHARRIQAEGREEGRAEGHIEGLGESLIAERQRVLLEVLEDLGGLTEELRKKILSQTNIETLRKWFRISVRAGHLLFLWVAAY